MPSIKKFKMILNNIEDIIENPCAPSWDVIISTAVPAAKDVIIFLIEPTLVDVLQAWAHPKFGRNRSRGRRPKYYERQETRAGEKRVVQRFGLPDINEVVAEKIPGRKFFGQRVAGPKEAWVWLGLDLLDRAQWYWLVASLAEEFIYDWSSGIVQSNFCSKKFNAIWQGGMTDTPGSNAFELEYLHPEVQTNIARSNDNHDLGPTGARAAAVNVVISFTIKSANSISNRGETRITWHDSNGSHTVNVPYTLPAHGSFSHTETFTSDSWTFLTISTPIVLPGNVFSRSGHVSVFGYIND